MAHIQAQCEVGNHADCRQALRSVATQAWHTFLRRTCDPTTRWRRNASQGWFRETNCAGQDRNAEDFLLVAIDDAEAWRSPRSKLFAFPRAQTVGIHFTHPLNHFQVLNTRPDRDLARMLSKRERLKHVHWFHKTRTSLQLYAFFISAT